MGVLEQLYQDGKKLIGDVANLTLEQLNARVQHERTLDMMRLENEIKRSTYQPQTYSAPQGQQSQPVASSNGNISISPLMLAMFAGGGLLLLRK